MFIYVSLDAFRGCQKQRNNLSKLHFWSKLLPFYSYVVCPDLGTDLYQYKTCFDTKNNLAIWQSLIFKSWKNFMPISIL